MVKFMNKIPAGTFLVPLLLSALVYTLWPNLMQVGGITEQFLGGGNVSFIIGVLSFFSGVGIDIKTLSKLIKRHGVIMLTKIILTIGLSLIFMAVFGQSGIFGISALAFAVTLASINPALYISLMRDYGDDVDEAAFGLTGLFSIPALPMVAFAFSGQGGVDWAPILSTIIPLLLGMLLGNLDKDFNKVFAGGVTVMLPILGWNLGQGMNLIESVQSGFSGILLAVVFYICMSPLVAVDKVLLKNDGVPAMAMNAAAATSASFPAIIAQTNPSLEPFVTNATAQVLTVAIISLFVTPVLVRKLYQKTHGEV